MKFGVKLYKNNIAEDEIEYIDLFFFTNEKINLNKTNNEIINNKLSSYYLNNDYNNLILTINKCKEKILNEPYKLKSSFLQPPVFALKRQISQIDGRWYFYNIYGYYFCFCKGELCINILSFNSYIFQSCKYFFYITIIDKLRYLYKKSHYLFSDFFDKTVESADSFPVFTIMNKKKFNAHYLTMSENIYYQFCNENKCNNLEIIYGSNKINGDFLEKYLELILKLKVVVTSEKYNSIDNIFYNIEYINYIFLGHGVTYIKSFLYKDYISPKRYNKILLPRSNKFISLALEAGWKEKDIIKIGYPKWDNYELFENKKFFQDDVNKKENSIFFMFTWRKLKAGKFYSDLYFDNTIKLLNNINLNKYLNISNTKIFFTYHHCVKNKKKIQVNNTENIQFLKHNNISLLLRNSSLIITDFSSIIFDAIIQRKPLILFIPDGEDPNLSSLYNHDYYETISKIKKGEIYLYEVFYDYKKVVDKIIYYIKSGFKLEKGKYKFYESFKLKNRYNTEKFINYIKYLK